MAPGRSIPARKSFSPVGARLPATAIFAAPEYCGLGVAFADKSAPTAALYNYWSTRFSPTHNPFAAIRFSEQIASQGSASRTPSFCQLATYLKKNLLFQ
jgi:hypothetical protein